MRVVEISEFGPPDVLRIGERPAPEPAAGEVLIKVTAAGVNRPDIAQRYGKYAPPPGVDPGKAPKFTIVLLYEKLVFISQWCARRLRAVSSTPLNARLKSGMFASVMIVGCWKVGW